MDLELEFSKILKQDDSGAVSRIGKLITKYGFDIHSVYDGNTTALHMASEFGNQHLVRALLHPLIRAQSDILRGDVKDGHTVIHVAAMCGKLRILEALLEELGSCRNSAAADIVDVDLLNRWKQTPLHFALGRGNVEVARFLIERGADVRKRDMTGATALHYAARSGVVEALELVLLEDVNESSYAGLTALHYAAWNGKIDAVEWLLEKGGDLTRIDKVEGGMPLHWAARKGKIHMVERLIRAHVRAGASVFDKNENGQNVLDLAEQCGHGNVIKPLLKAMDESLGLLDEHALPKWALVRYVVLYGDEAMNVTLGRSLAYAARKWRARVVALFSDRDEEDLTLMDWAALTKGSSKDTLESLVKLVKEYLPQRDLDSQLESALQLALLRKNTVFAAMLVKPQGDVNHPSIAAWIKGMKRHFDTDTRVEDVRRQLEYRDKKFKDDIKGRLMRELPFAYLVFLLGREDIASFIDEQDAWEEIVNEQGPRTGRTALHWATILQHKGIVARLCSIKECKTNLSDRYGISAYRYALEQRRQDIQKVLMEREDVRSHLEVLYRDRQVFVDASNAILVGGALIAGITFAGFLQPPLGNRPSSSNPSNSSASYVDKTVQIFWVFNSLSFFFAMATTLVGARGVLPMQDFYIRDVVNYIRKTLLFASIMLVVSITFVLFAFGAAGFAALPPSIKYEVNMLGTVTLGGILCISTLAWFIKGLYSFLPPRLKREDFFCCNRRELRERPAASLLLADDPSVSGSQKDQGQARSQARAQARALARVESEEEARGIKYEVGAGYAEFPWEDGLDRLYHKLHSASSTGLHTLNTPMSSTHSM